MRAFWFGDAPGKPEQVGPIAEVMTLVPPQPQPPVEPSQSLGRNWKDAEPTIPLSATCVSAGVGLRTSG